MSGDGTFTPSWDFIENLKIPDFMYFSPGSELEDHKVEIKLTEKHSFGIFGVTGVWFLVLREEGQEIWTMQCYSKTDAHMKAVIEAFKLRTEEVERLQDMHFERTKLTTRVIGERDDARRRLDDMSKEIERAASHYPHCRFKNDYDGKSCPDCSKKDDGIKKGSEEFRSKEALEAAKRWSARWKELAETYAGMKYIRTHGLRNKLFAATNMLRAVEAERDGLLTWVENHGKKMREVEAERDELRKKNIALAEEWRHTENGLVGQLSDWKACAAKFQNKLEQHIKAVKEAVVVSEGQNEELKGLRHLLGWAETAIDEMECRQDEDCDHCYGLQIIADIKKDPSHDKRREAEQAEYQASVKELKALRRLNDLVKERGYSVPADLAEDLGWHD